MRRWGGYGTGCVSKRKKLDAAPGSSTRPTPAAPALPAGIAPQRTGSRASFFVAVHAVTNTTPTSTLPRTSLPEVGFVRPRGARPAHHAWRGPGRGSAVAGRPRNPASHEPPRLSGPWGRAGPRAPASADAERTEMSTGPYPR